MLLENIITTDSRAKILIQEKKQETIKVKHQYMLEKWLANQRTSRVDDNETKNPKMK